MNFFIPALVVSFSFLLGNLQAQPLPSIPLHKISLALNWVPEPEFGGFYAAKFQKVYEKYGLDVELIAGGASSPTIQMVAAGKVNFAIASAGELMIARSRGAKVKAIYSVYQKSPFVLMAHESRGFKTIADIFKEPGVLAIERGLPFATFLEKKFGFSKLKVVPYTGGVANFLRDPKFVQQGFIFSEPILAKRQGARPQVFSIEEAGWKNSYVALVITTDESLLQQYEVSHRFASAIREGWELYLEDPKPTNEAMAKLNKAMDLQTFHEGALAQAPLLRSAETNKMGLGVMTEAAWKAQAQELLDLKLVSKIFPPKEYFQNF